jgi:uncharacterized membrane protein
MNGKFIRNWFFSFVLAVLPDILWHRFLFGSFYGSSQKGIERVANGHLAPLIPFIIVMDILLAFGFTYFMNGLSTVNKRYILNGLLFGLIVTGYFSLASYALIPGWHPAVSALDAGAGLLAGLLQGLLFSYLNRRAEPAGQYV